MFGDVQYDAGVDYLDFVLWLEPVVFALYEGDKWGAYGVALVDPAAVFEVFEVVVHVGGCE